MADGDVREVAVVLRYAYYDGATPEQCLALMSWHEDLTAADAEAARLNSVRPSGRAEYFVKILRDRSASLSCA